MGKLVAVNEAGYRIGESHPRSVLSDLDVEEIRNLHEIAGKSYGWISMRKGISYHTVARICRYERRNQVVAIWKRVQ